ncbi:hypothetical protein NDU88_012851 [Pleurodeles waltl]|uniref:Uncharacterized protein n=1 Tax=Pleurodeles waltl TaxID=8319 RepID=A0AAV7R7A1_PLEWA|nr:hypothetical protein NDU88_012851 [Pleurodeles waltl]
MQLSTSLISLDNIIFLDAFNLRWATKGNQLMDIVYSFLTHGERDAGDPRAGSALPRERSPETRLPAPCREGSGSEWRPTVALRRRGRCYLRTGIEAGGAVEEADRGPDSGSHPLTISDLSAEVRDGACSAQRRGAWSRGSGSRDLGPGSLRLATEVNARGGRAG